MENKPTNKKYKGNQSHELTKREGCSFRRSRSPIYVVVLIDIDYPSFDFRRCRFMKRLFLCSGNKQHRLNSCVIVFNYWIVWKQTFVNRLIIKRLKLDIWKQPIIWRRSLNRSYVWDLHASLFFSVFCWTFSVFFLIIPGKPAH